MAPALSFSISRSPTSVNQTWTTFRRVVQKVVLVMRYQLKHCMVLVRQMIAYKILSRVSCEKREANEKIKLN